MADNKGIGFLLKQVKTEQFAIIEEAYKEGGNIGFASNLQFSIDQENKFVACFAKFIYDENNCTFLVIEVSAHFSIIEAAWKSFYDADNASMTIPKSFLAHLGMITVGTARGILHAKTENTVFNAFLIPTINVVEIVKEDAQFSELTHH